PSTAMAIAAAADPPAADRRLEGRALFWAWSGVVAVGVVVLGVWIASIVADFQLSAPAASAAAIAVVLTLNIGFLAGCLIPAGFVLWQRPRDWLALLAAVALLAFGVTVSPALNELQTIAHEWNALYLFMRSLGQIALFLFLYIFPNG